MKGTAKHLANSEFVRGDTYHVSGKATSVEKNQQDGLTNPLPIIQAVTRVAALNQLRENVFTSPTVCLCEVLSTVFRNKPTLLLQVSATVILIATKLESYTIMELTPTP